jgi:hypothetical protein
LNRNRTGKKNIAQLLIDACLAKICAGRGMSKAELMRIPIGRAVSVRQLDPSAGCCGAY